MDFKTFKVVVRESLPFETKAIGTLAQDIFNNSNQISKRRRLQNSEPLLFGAVEEISTLTEEPESWKADITKVFNRKFPEHANIVSAVLRGHEWSSEGASAFDKMTFLSGPLLQKLADAPDIVRNRAVKLASRFMGWDKKRSDDQKPIKDGESEDMAEKGSQSGGSTADGEAIKQVDITR